MQWRGILSEKNCDRIHFLFFLRWFSCVNKTEGVGPVSSTAASGSGCLSYKSWPGDQLQVFHVSPQYLQTTSVNVFQTRPWPFLPYPFQFTHHPAIRRSRPTDWTTKQNRNAKPFRWQQLAMECRFRFWQVMLASRMGNIGSGRKWLVSFTTWPLYFRGMRTLVPIE
jgi:hypothetical protein